MRELADNLSEESKQKICNSREAKELEKSGAFSFINAGVSEASAGVIAYSSEKIGKIKAENDSSGAEVDFKSTQKNSNW